jgi:hypothetical protein
MSSQSPDYTVMQMLQSHLPNDGEWHDFIIRSRRVGNIVEIAHLYTADNETIHTIPVPDGWSIEQAWETIRRADILPSDIPVTWASIVVKDGHIDVIETRE